MSFKLAESFIKQYENKEVDWGPLGEVTYLRTYSRIKEDGTQERWIDTVKRVVEGSYYFQKKHCESLRLPWKSDKAQKSAQIMFDKIFNFKFLPSGRNLWMMGTKFVEEKGSMALLNCAAVTTADISTRGSFSFVWTMDALMLGAGVSYDTMGAGKIVIKEPKLNGVFQVPDSREGWVESVKILLDSYFLGKELPSFDYSLIRPYGEKIKGFGGVASGYEPLKALHEGFIKLLNKKVGVKISSTDIADLMDMIGVCVVSGNVRRSALLALGDWDDADFVEMKNSEKYPEETSAFRWASNNSIKAIVGKTDYKKISKSIAINGEPGFIWLDNVKNRGRMEDAPDTKDKYVCALNPCGEIPLESLELCNLSETFPSRHDSYEEFKETLKYAYLYSKTVTLIPTHVPETNAVMMKNRRIGISQSGIVDAFVKHGRRTMMGWNDAGYKYLKELDELYSNWLCVPRSIRLSTTKPSGSVSLLPGVSPGIHYPHSKYYIRRIRIASNSPLVLPLMDAGYAFEPSFYGMSEEEKSRTLVFSFPVEEKYFEKGKDDVSVWEQVKNAVDYQRWWSDNAVSVTVTFNKDELDDVPLVLEAYEDSLKGISFLPVIDKGAYEQMPYESISKETYVEMASKIKKPDFSSITSIEAAGEKYCSNEGCSI